MRCGAIGLWRRCRLLIEYWSSNTINWDTIIHSSRIFLLESDELWPTTRPYRDIILRIPLPLLRSLHFFPLSIQWLRRMFLPLLSRCWLRSLRQALSRVSRNRSLSLRLRTSLIRCRLAFGIGRLIYSASLRWGLAVARIALGDALAVHFAFLTCVWSTSWILSIVARHRVSLLLELSLRLRLWLLRCLLLCLRLWLGSEDRLLPLHFLWSTSSRLCLRTNTLALFSKSAALVLTLLWWN